MKYISLCDGIGAAHLAFRPLGWECDGVAEIDSFCNAVVEHHFCFENFGDICNGKAVQQIADKKPDLIVGGTPCQSFLQAGNNKGTADERGMLVFQFFDIIRDAQPDWFIWENVSHVLRVNEGRDFRKILQTVDQNGYSCAWNVYTALSFGLPARRERVFMVGFRGGPERPAMVLLDSCGPFRNSKASQKGSRKYRSEICGSSRFLLPHCAKTLLASPSRKDHRTESFIIQDGRARCFSVRERLKMMGFPPDYLDIEFNGKPACKTSQCKAVGNSIAVPILKFIGERIDKYKTLQII